jgi:SAM-dependent methyltransferase
MALNIREQFGQIDIYVFDQILRGNIKPDMRVLDAGCGYGRNLVHLLREGCEVFALEWSMCVSSRRRWEPDFLRRIFKLE